MSIAGAGDSTSVITFFVAPDGHDDWSGRSARPDAGRTDGPFATLGTACRAARKSGAKQPRTIVVQAGEYFLDEPVVLAAEDSGLAIEAAVGAAIRLYGGRKVSGWEKDGDTFYAAKLSGVRKGKWDFRALIVNGRYCPRARLPKEGYYQHESVFNVPWITTTGGGWKRKPTDEELTTMKYQPEDLGPGLDTGNAEVSVYHMWDESLVGASAYYLDERSENCLVEGNLSANVVRPSHNHMAVNNTIRNNVFIHEGDMQLTFPRSSGYTFERNILCAGGKITFDNFEALSTAAGNVFFSRAGQVECHKLDRYNRTGSYSLEPGASNDQTDPMLTAYQQGKVEFAPGSVARELGMRPIDVSQAGPRP